MSVRGEMRCRSQEKAAAREEFVTSRLRTKNDYVNGRAGRMVSEVELVSKAETKEDCHKKAVRIVDEVKFVSHTRIRDVLPQLTSTHIESESTVSSGGGGAPDGTSKRFLITSRMLWYVDRLAPPATRPQPHAFASFSEAVVPCNISLNEPKCPRRNIIPYWCRSSAVHTVTPRRLPPIVDLQPSRVFGVALQRQSSSPNVWR